MVTSVVQSKTLAWRQSRGGRLSAAVELPFSSVLLPWHMKSEGWWGGGVGRRARVALGAGTGAEDGELGRRSGPELEQRTMSAAAGARSEERRVGKECLL